ncbi:MPP10, U3 small nucleolar RNA-associated protein MPP10 [Babesia microti strain RI]|uniref:MPP10, U3 small nucleolar RNA-associated protein MPP10 n=1 Tax=Babesia microti (strain RI) TaxID=1133968 RepID=I7IG01_BABMR|nr:MPP10, U3 small nucleolar RNA-associated protein MPP10 [Babesia microti strain RI]CCF73226.1 MPP10, U3 small nucleolar RNA-associated protein MPP10 [Babesia microti strain RI]|eukprot:XP_012647835.1 MPP10, U3 small nucleolar RNA-associated protein MPP10 [Babesia microti strain RI]
MSLHHIHVHNLYTIAYRIGIVRSVKLGYEIDVIDQSNRTEIRAVIMVICLPPVSKFAPPVEFPGRLFDISKDEVQSSLSQVLRAAIFLRRKKIFLKKEAKKRRVHSVLTRAGKLAAEYSAAVQDSALHLDLDQLWDLVENTLHHRINKLVHSPATNYNGSILKYPPSRILTRCNNGVNSEFKSDTCDTNVGLRYTDCQGPFEVSKSLQSDKEDISSSDLKENLIKEDNIQFDSDIPLDMEDMERFVSQNMGQGADEDGPDLFDSLGDESDGSVPAKDMKYSDFFAPINATNSIPGSFDKADIERELVAPKHWSMRGEVRAKDRPKDSLLELDLDFIYSNKDAGASTSISQEAETDVVPLEMIIRQRIQARVFDNVEPKNFSINTIREERNVEAKGDMDLDFSRSERGLAEIYAEKYRKEVEKVHQGKLNEISKDRLEIADLFSKILYKLDCLSNLNFLPRAPTDTSTRTGDDIVPTIAAVTSNAHAPRERVKDKGEMTREEKRSLRRLNKERHNKRMVKNGMNAEEDNTKRGTDTAKSQVATKRMGKLKTAELLQKRAAARLET